MLTGTYDGSKVKSVLKGWNPTVESCMPADLRGQNRFAVACREAVIAVVNGCDMNAPCPCPPAVALVRDTNNLAGGANSEASTSTAGFCALHFACQVQCPCFDTNLSNYCCSKLPTARLDVCGSDLCGGGQVVTVLHVRGWALSCLLTRRTLHMFARGSLL